MKLDVEKNDNRGKNLVIFRLEIGCKFTFAEILSHWNNPWIFPHFITLNQRWEWDPLYLALGISCMDICCWAGHPDFLHI